MKNFKEMLKNFKISISFFVLNFCASSAEKFTVNFRRELVPQVPKKFTVNFKC